jgi:hypothetical protein
MKPRKHMLGPATMFFILVMGTSTALAQFTSGIDGTVSDPSGAVVPNATVTIKNMGTEVTRNVQTSSAGYYRFTSLPAAVFNITVTAPGFKTTVREKIPVAVTEIRTVDVTLEIGAATTEVTVTGAPPAIETSQGRISGYVDQVKVHELPLVGRNYFTLVVLTPGVTGLPAGGGQSYAQATGDIFTTEYGASLNANGQRGMANYFAVDSGSTNGASHGGITNISPAADAVQEVRISTNDFSAEYGRNSSVIVNAITKQGTNDWHGTMSFFHTDNLLQSRNIFQVPKGPVFRRNEYAWTLGGPIWKDHTFVFASMDGLRSGVGYGYPTVVGTPEFINFMDQNHPSNISTSLWKTYGSAIVPSGNFTTAGKMAGVDCSTLPSPSSPISSAVGTIPCNLPVTGEGSYAAISPRNGLQWLVRVDQTFNSMKDRLYGSAIKTTLDTVLFNSPNVYPAFTQPWHEWTYFYNLNYTHTFSPTVLNEFGFSLDRNAGDDKCDPCEIPGISMPGMAGFGQGWGPGVFVMNIYQWRDVVTFNRGSHNLKTGITLGHNEDYDDFGRIQTRPQFSFFSVFDFAMDNPYFEGNIGIDPLTGNPIDAAKGYVSSRDMDLGLFVQDDWKVKPNLTLNLGLRWEILNGNPRQRYHNTTRIFFQGGDDFQSTIANAKMDFASNIWNGTDYNNFAPRISFAWDPTKKGKISVRGGGGVFYDRIPCGNGWNGINKNPPNAALVSASIYTPPTLPVYGLGQSGKYPFGFPRVTGITAGLDAKNGLLGGKAGLEVSDPNLRTQYSYNWFFGAQYAFTNNWVLEANVIGSAGHKLVGDYDVNRFAGDLIQNNNVLTRLNTSFGNINFLQNRFNSFYSGGTVALKKRMSHGLTLDGVYTFGKAIDNFSIGGGGNDSGGQTADGLDVSRERGLAVFDIRNRLALSALWQLPRPKFRSAFLNGFLGGWQLSNVTILQGGSPYSVYCSLSFMPIRDASGVIVGNSGCDYNADGVNYDYPMTPAFGNFKSGSRSDYIKGLFSASDFPTPPMGVEGDLGRNTFIGPGYANTDFSVIKNTKIPWFIGKEGANVQFRTEIFNLFNRVNLTQVNGDLASSFFGRSTSTFSARNIQFGMRISF